MFLLPLLNLGKVARQKYIGNTPTAKLRRAGIYGWSQQIILKTVGQGRRFVANSARNQSYDRVGNNAGRQFATRQDIIADGNLSRDEVLADAVVNTLIVATQDNYILTGENVGISAKKVIFACGLLSGGAKLGSFGDTIRMFKALGYETSKTTPAIVQLKTETDIVRQLKGIKVTGTATLKIAGKQICSKQDEILFTDYGLSGPAILGISREAARVNDTVVVSLDIMPNINAAELEKLLISRKSDLAARSSENFLTGLINKRLGQVLLKNCHIPLNILCADIEDVQISHLADLIKNFTFTVTGNTGFNNSQVTAGGIKLTEVDINTLEARRHKGLYIIGELLDVDGDCGGFNLQWAWSSAAVAARSAAK